MGEPSQRRLLRKIDLEKFLSKIKPHPSPDVRLEQYTISEPTAGTMLYLAAYQFGDIVDKRVVDLGCGTGRLALGAAFMGAEYVVGLDIDRTAIEHAYRNAVETNLKRKVDWILGSLDAVGGRFDTVIQNPPFGVQLRTADRRFLKKALDVGNSIYSLHNHPVVDKQLMEKLKSGGRQFLQVLPSPFVQRFVEKHGGRLVAVYALLFSIPRMFNFHAKERREIVTDLYVIKKE